MRLIRAFFQRLFVWLARKATKLLFFCVFGILVWIMIITPATKERADELIMQGKELYHEDSGNYQIRQDSFATYIYYIERK